MIPSFHFHRLFLSFLAKTHGDFNQFLPLSQGAPYTRLGRAGMAFRGIKIRLVLRIYHMKAF
jgi:hypothetical protein